MVAPGLVNLDFADIRTVMAEMGKAMMGTGEADGENRAIRAAEAAISNPLLEDTSMAGAHGLLINITGGEDMTLFEVDQAANRIREEVDEEANIIFGSAIDDTLNGKIRVSVVATGIDTPAHATAERPRLVAVGGNDAPASQPGAGQAAAMGIATAPPAASAPPSIGRPSGAPTVAPVLPPRPQVGRVTPGPHQPQPSPTVQVASRATAAVLETEPQVYEPESYAGAPQVSASVAAAPRPISTPDPRLRPAPTVHPAPGRAPEVRPQSRSNGLFAEPRSEPVAPAPRSRSLFGIVTGAIRGNPNATGQADPSSRGGVRANGTSGQAESIMHDGRVEPARPSVRPAVEDEEMQIEIPAFLRRQSS
jgi:cell division protein FtsZ